jgi:hypothetical protein
MKIFSALILALVLLIPGANATTSVRFGLRYFTGSSLSRTINLVPNNPVITDATNFWTGGSISIPTTNGEAMATLEANDYTMSLEGLSDSWLLQVYETNGTVNAAALCPSIPMTTYSGLDLTALIATFNSFAAQTNVDASLAALSNAVIAVIATASNNAVATAVSTSTVNLNQALTSYATVTSLLSAYGASVNYANTNVTMATVLGWALGPTLEMSTSPYTNGTVQAVSVTWPDGVSGVFTPTLDTTWGAINGYSITRGRYTFTQPIFARDENGNPINIPAMTITTNN